MRLLILTQYFPPETGAAQARLLAVARCLHDDGHEVRLVTALPNHPTGRLLPGYRMRLGLDEIVEGIPVHRTWVYPALGSGFRRMVNYASFCIACAVPLLRAPRPDYLFVESPPLFLVVPAVLIARLRRVPLILNVADLWPDSVAQLDQGTPPWVLGLFGRLERWAYDHAAFVTAVTDGILATLIGEKGVPSDKVLFLPNGVDLETYAPAADFDPPEPATFVYAGTHGVAHGLDTVLAAADLLRNEPFQFVFVGDGSDKDRLITERDRRALTNVKFLDALPPVDVAVLLRTATAGVACLRDEPVLRGARSVKVFSIMAAGRPVLYSGMGEDRHIIEAADCGIIVPPGDARGLADGARRLADDGALAARLGANGRRYAEEHLGWGTLVRRWSADLASASTSERARLNVVYRGYREDNRVRRRWDRANAGNRAIERERDRTLVELLRAIGRPLGPDVAVLEVGCGSGGVLRRVEEAGASPKNLVGCDVRVERLVEAQKTHAGYGFVAADGQELPFANEDFDLVLLFTVLSSVLDDEVAKRIAAEINRVLRPGGVVAWYDARRQNPRNPHTRPVPPARMASLFPGYGLRMRAVTLVPPLARRLGPLTAVLYAPLAVVPWSRTHLVGVLRKPHVHAEAAITSST